MNELLNSSHVIRFADGCLMKQPFVLSPGADQQNPTGQDTESVLKACLLCRANWICFSGENSTSIDSIKFYYKLMGFINWKYEILPKGWCR